MLQSYRLPLLIITLLLVMQVLFEIYRPKPIDWTSTYEKKDKIPNGCYITHQMLDDYFGKHTIKVVRQPIYNQMSDDHALLINENDNNNPSDSTAIIDDLDKKDDQADDTIHYTQYANSHQSEQYIIITENFSPDILDSKHLWRFAETGGTVFIAAQQISDTLAKMLHIETDWHIGNWNDTSSRRKTSFTHPNLRKQASYHFRNQYLKSYFSRLDTTHALILGQMDSSIYPNFVRIACGSGAFYLHSAPHLFANYTAVNDSGAAYIAQVFSHLPASPNISYWDEYYKPLRLPNETPLRYILSTEALRWAFYLMLIGIALLMLLDSKRRQRPIPIIEPLRNTTLDFARTIGLLYYQNGDHRDLAQKKITHFIDFLRTRLFLPPVQYDRNYYGLIAQKAALPLADIESIFKLIIQVRTQVAIEPATLLELSRRIDAFYVHFG